ncbi:hypothetical protein H5410_030106 [Solanum commersonii]|uniref:Reverse transcriptase zinc-binding domain-containing protein n=1 Tax=Solanum commersonii TaxID=4109 RepID=A0A9J5YGH7_SOLCO|nr:hypothetical protein H5410_030106 [Solanum commersonii]
MKRIGMSYLCNGIPFLSYFTTSLSVRPYSSAHVIGLPINFENVKCLDEAVILFTQMVTMKPLPSLVDFSKLFKTIIIMKHYSAVVSLFREMRKLGIPINEFILSNVINNFCLMNRVECAFSILPIYLKNGIPFNVVAFNTLIRGFFAENKVKNAVELFKKLVREKICEPDEVMYATVMNGLSKGGHTEKTLSLLRLMEQENTFPKPDIFIYTIVMDALCKDGNFDVAITLLNEMKQRRIHPNIVTYNSLIDGMCKLGQWEKVRNFVSEMAVNLNICPDVCTFNIMIDGLCKEGKVADAEELMKHMVRKGVEPDIITYNTIMDGYCLCGQLDEAKRTFDIMIDKCIEHDIISYNILINGYHKKNKLAEAMQLFCEISQKGLKSNIVTYTTILQEPMSLFKKLERKREVTSIAFYSVVTNGKLEEARAIFEKLSFIGLLPNVRTYTGNNRPLQFSFFVGVFSLFGVNWEFEDVKLEAISLNDQVCDSPWWKIQKDGKFIVEVCYKNLLGNMGGIHKDWPWKTVWKTIASPRVTCFTWIATPNLVLCSRCFLCASANEAVNHPLLHCTFSKQFWTMFHVIFCVQWIMPGCTKRTLSSWYEQLHLGTMSTTQLLFLPAFSGNV